MIEVAFQPTVLNDWLRVRRGAASLGSEARRCCAVDGQPMGSICEASLLVYAGIGTWAALAPILSAAWGSVQSSVTGLRSISAIRGCRSED